MFSKKMYVDGKLVVGNLTANIINPANNLIAGDIAVAGLQQAESALQAAKAALPMWSTTPVAERVEWMGKLLDAVIMNETHLRECIHLEMGKPWEATGGDYQLLVDSLRFYAEEIQHMAPEEFVDREGTHTHIISRQPVGVVAAFLAWNFPVLNLAYKLGPALAAGCPIVIKPSIKTPLSAYAVGELCHQIGLPAGVVNIITGNDSEVGNAISASTIPAMLTLIGSTRTGLHIMRTGATSVKRYSMELGGNAPVLVFADADLDLAADIICSLKFTNSGQICVAPNRVYVDESVADEFIKKVVERAKAVTVGFNKNADIKMGPVIDEESLIRIDNLVKDAVSKGATLLTGGCKPEGLEAGAFYAPTVLVNVTSKMNLYSQEIFGPVISLMTFTNTEALVSEANNTEAGLTAYIFTRDLAKADRIASELQFGEVQINGVKYSIELPHCGMKQSGIGVDCSNLALDDFLVTKRISRALNV